jgi:hypothetical protein
MASLQHPAVSTQKIAVPDLTTHLETRIPALCLKTLGCILAANHLFREYELMTEAHAKFSVM